MAIGLAQLLAIIVVSTSASAGPASPTSNPSVEQINEPCQATSALGQGECAWREYEAADQALNDTYHKLMAALPEKQIDSWPREAMKRSQTAWIKYRDARCDSEAALLGGSGTWVSAYSVSCQAQTTEERTRELENYLRCATEGGGELCSISVFHQPTN